MSMEVGFGLPGGYPEVEGTMMQAMEDDVAAMATPGGVGEQPGMARQDSALELDESARTPSPTRRTTSPGKTHPGTPFPWGCR
jgi:hypothetical protein